MINAFYSPVICQALCVIPRIRHSHCPQVTDSEMGETGRSGDSSTAVPIVTAFNIVQKVLLDPTAGSD